MFDLLGNLGKRVEVALDLHSPHRWLIKTHEKSPWSRKKKSLNGKPRDKNKDITMVAALRDCHFFVDVKQRQACMKSAREGKRRKNLHAWVIGTLVKPEEVCDSCTIEVIYDCKEYSSFVLKKTKTPIHEASMAFFTFSDSEERFKVYVPRSRLKGPRK
jgi:hypothetical protein